MNFKTAVAKLITVSLLIFANSLFVAAQPDSIYRLPAGTRIRLKMDVELSSKAASVNDTFTAVVSKPVMIRDAVMLPVGTVFEGRVVSVTRAAAGSQSGKLVIVIDRLRVGKDVSRSIDALTLTKFKAESSQTLDTLSVIGSTAVGALIGFAAKSGTGALIGAGIGAGVGTGTILVRKGKEVRIREDQEFEIELKSDVVLPVLDY